MSVVILSSGGLDSTLLIHLALENGTEVYPLFVNYGQLAMDNELATCRFHMSRLGLRERLKVVDIPGYGEAFPSGLTSSGLDISEDAFLPCRNLMFVSIGAAHAFRNGCSGVALGLLDDENHIFPDQTRSFVESAEHVIEESLSGRVSLMTPLMHMTKSNVSELARDRNIYRYWSCHSEGPEPCGKCIGCKEYTTEEN